LANWAGPNGLTGQPIWSSDPPLLRPALSRISAQKKKALSRTGVPSGDVDRRGLDSGRIRRRRLPAHLRILLLLRTFPSGSTLPTAYTRGGHETLAPPCLGRRRDCALPWPPATPARRIRPQPRPPELHLLRFDNRYHLQDLCVDLLGLAVVWCPLPCFSTSSTTSAAPGEATAAPASTSSTSPSSTSPASTTLGHASRVCSSTSPLLSLSLG
jgi:hypothetical protein